jgi:hypothetical protein
MERIPSEKEVRQQAKIVFRKNVRLLTLACIEHAKGRVSQDSLIKIIDGCRNDMSLSSDKLVENLLKKINGEKKFRG